MSDWQPIETAPKDGTPILLVCVSRDDRYSHLRPEVAAGRWTTDAKYPWQVFDPDVGESINGWMEGSPTHWMPLPAPPPTQPEE